MPVLGLHGIAQHRNTPELLRKLWYDSLLQGFDNAAIPERKYHLEIPYYGRLLAGREACGSGQKTVSTDENYREDQVAASMKAEIAHELEKRLKRRPTDIDDQMKGPANSLLKLISNCLSNEREAWFIDAVLDQVSRYLSQRDIREKIQSTSRAALAHCMARRTAGDDAVIVIAHSLGSVIAYDLLSSWNGDDVDLLLTVGSPLSIKGVYSRLNGQPPRWPGPVKTWINLADQDDIVALHGRIDRTNLFSRASPRERCDVLNVLDIKNHMRNHHGIAGYLDDPVLATIVGRFLGNTRS